MGVMYGNGDAVARRTSLTMPFAELIQTEQPVPVDWAVLMPGAHEVATGPIVCVPTDTDSSIRKDGEQVEVTMSGATLLGECPGTPIDGQLRICIRGQCPASFDFGSVHGTAWTLGSSDSGFVNGLHELHFNPEDDTLIRAPSASAGDPYAWAVIFTDRDGPFSGEVLCASGQLSEQDFGAGPIKVWEFNGLSTLGICPAGGSDTVTGCVR
jgi:hypothetical protein